MIRKSLSFNVKQQRNALKTPEYETINQRYYAFEQKHPVCVAFAIVQSDNMTLDTLELFGWDWSLQGPNT